MRGRERREEEIEGQREREGGRERDGETDGPRGETGRERVRWIHIHTQSPRMAIRRTLNQLIRKREVSKID